MVTYVAFRARVCRDVNLCVVLSDTACLHQLQSAFLKSGSPGEARVDLRSAVGATPGNAPAAPFANLFVSPSKDSQDVGAARPSAREEQAFEKMREQFARVREAREKKKAAAIAR